MSQSMPFRRTDQAIIQAAIRLLRRKSFSEITVQDILEETPVSRATFYAHFHDKYEVAERMQALYVQLMHDIPAKMKELRRENHAKLIQDSLLEYREIVQALMKIRTEQVDLRAVTAEMYRGYYLSQESGPYAEAEAEIYAQAMTALQLTYLSGDSASVLDADYYDKVMVSVFLHILKQEGNSALRNTIFRYLPSGCK